MLIIIIAGRCLAVWSVDRLFNLCSKEKSNISVSELSFITYGGMIRGAIAFGLALKIPDEASDSPDYFNERGVIITTTLACIIFTTVIFGSFMPIV
jgi:NhaP-type Na+/H+ or K+/H+ antiporter